MRILFNFDKKATLLSSVANCLFMQKKFDEAIKVYEEARGAIAGDSVDLKNSIVGNMAICYVEMGKCSQN